MNENEEKEVSTKNKESNQNNEKYKYSRINLKTIIQKDVNIIIMHPKSFENDRPKIFTAENRQQKLLIILMMLLVIIHNNIAVRIAVHTDQISPIKTNKTRKKLSKLFGFGSGIREALYSCSSTHFISTSHCVTPKDLAITYGLKKCNEINDHAYHVTGHYSFNKANGRVAERVIDTNFGPKNEIIRSRISGDVNKGLQLNSSDSTEY
uniref:Uncharacterized protein n=1 Tax=Romanomermis culicivorax TaxID=13658 RepID=A0A915I0F0_ROMCU